MVLYIIEEGTVDMAFNKRGVNCLRGVFENFFRFKKILCVNPEQESS